MFLKSEQLLNWSRNPYVSVLAPLLGTDISKDRQALYYALSLNNCANTRNTRRILCKRGGTRILAIGPAGNARSYKNANEMARRYGYKIWAADGSALLFYEATGSYPDVIVSDLDANPRTYILAQQFGTLLVIQPHADNYYRLPHFASLIEECNTIISSQTEPFSSSIPHNGFTDGDRILYLALGCGVKNIVLCCYDFTRISSLHKQTYQKEIKLMISKMLIKKLLEEYGKKLKVDILTH
ncbi:MAG: hypothetical protein F7C32_01675 [Desulfurococcales archaeon]|nr:hypothetical protein [Desulfurococcales archaeon]